MNIHNKESMMYYLLKNKRQKESKNRKVKGPLIPERLDTKLSLLTAPNEPRKSYSINHELSIDKSGLIPPDDRYALNSTQKRQAIKDGYIPGCSTSTIGGTGFADKSKELYSNRSDNRS
uniref:Uncharacterized protein n=1 Tax=Euplotes harpa TaxID=151035 RepID=A0A7S3JKC3_9SPIT|mmetsp:Transcript_42249/g.49135  ORF Transcript_42249/g.49135 Transcript_42249/m.49135 type:complete len:119 (+) Transcript_42249:1264-1620(+)